MNHFSLIKFTHVQIQILVLEDFILRKKTLLTAKKDLKELYAKNVMRDFKDKDLSGAENVQIEP